jgi:hypothetical protein
VPYRDDKGGWRHNNFDVVYTQLQTLGIEFIVGDSGDEPFSIARTWNRLADKAGDWDYLIRWAADFVLVDPLASLELALDRMDRPGRPGSVFVVLNDTSTTLDPAETMALHNNTMLLSDPDRSRVHLGKFRNQTEDTGKLLFGGPSIITRELWDEVGGFDERFVGYGFEDTAFVHCAEVFFGPRERVAGHLLNMHHPRKDCQHPYWKARDVNRQRWTEILRIQDPGTLKAYLRMTRDT